MNTVKYLLPTWTVYVLANRDESWLEDHEVEALNKFLSREGAKYQSFYTIDFKEEGFKATNDLNNIGSDCHTVTFDIGKG